MGLPSLQALVGGGGGASLLSSHIFQGGGFRTTLGGFELRLVGGCSFLCFAGAFCESNMNHFEM